VLRASLSCEPKRVTPFGHRNSEEPHASKQLPARALLTCHGIILYLSSSLTYTATSCRCCDSALSKPHHALPGFLANRKLDTSDSRTPFDQALGSSCSTLAFTCSWTKGALNLQFLAARDTTAIKYRYITTNIVLARAVAVRGCCTTPAGCLACLQQAAAAADL
jgi:hypothetical protein